MIKGLKLHRYFDAGLRQSYITPDGIRIFGTADRYFDVDTGYFERNSECVPSASIYNPNPCIPSRNNFTARVRGGFKVDRIEAEEVVPSFGGAVLCGASFSSSGYAIKAFGKYKNMQGNQTARAEWDSTKKAFRVYHSIGHTSYIPIVQVSGWESNNIDWSLTPRVYEIEPYYFIVRLLTNNDNPFMGSFSYVAYKTE